MLLSEDSTLTTNTLIGWFDTAAHRSDPPPHAARLQMRAGSGSTIQMHEDASGGVCLLWGSPGHPTVDRDRIAAWCYQTIVSGVLQKLRDLHGPFVALVSERGNDLAIATDAIGVRPWFFAQCKDGVAIGTNVWALIDAGLLDATPRIDYDAVAMWLYTFYNGTAGSLFEGVRRTPAGSVLTFEAGAQPRVEVWAELRKDGSPC
ncbi:MAG: hypothetical protein ACR2RB_20430, partial [Gammaproteobacteria bacterium]